MFTFIQEQKTYMVYKDVVISNSIFIKDLLETYPDNMKYVVPSFTCPIESFISFISERRTPKHLEDYGDEFKIHDYFDTKNYLFSLIYSLLRESIEVIRNESMCLNVY